MTDDADAAVTECPPVVFVAQLGTGGASWQPVLDRLTCGAPVITYDRPGTGSAPGRPAPNPPLPYSAFADELAAVLDDQGVAQPVVLVGHSFGSLIARMFAATRPHRVAGVVHVDGSIPRMRLVPTDTDDRIDGGTVIDTIAGETELIVLPQPHVPAAVLACTPGRLWPAWPDNIERLWTAHQRALANQIDAPLILAADAGHQIPREAPTLVAYAVDAVVGAVRGGSRTVRLDTDAVAATGGHLVG